MAFNNKNFYEILELTPNATEEEIKTSYRKLARKFHPDVNKDSNAGQMFKDILNAYETLSDENKRKNYDIINGIFKTTAQKQDTFTSSQKAQEEYKKETNNHFYNQTSKINSSKNLFHYIYKNVKYFIKKFKKNKKQQDIKKPQKGENITTEVTISPEEALTGSKRIINVRTTRTCPKCNGHKFSNGNKCSKCSGSGQISETKKITVTIPKGVKNGSKLRLKGEGGFGKFSGANGDLFIIIKIVSNTQIRHDKLNLYYNVPITPFEAALGEEISIPVFDGKIKLKLPKNTNSGQRFRISGQGLHKHGKTGDLIITVSIEFSHNLSDDEIKLYKELQKISKDNIREKFGYGS